VWASKLNNLIIWKCKLTCIEPIEVVVIIVVVVAVVPFCPKLFHLIVDLIYGAQRVNLQLGVGDKFKNSL